MSLTSAGKKKFYGFVREAASAACGQLALDDGGVGRLISRSPGFRAELTSLLRQYSATTLRTGADAFTAALFQKDEWERAARSKARYPHRRKSKRGDAFVSEVAALAARRARIADEIREKDPSFPFR